MKPDPYDTALRAVEAAIARYAATRSAAHWVAFCDAVDLVKALHEEVLKRSLERAKRVAK